MNVFPPTAYNPYSVSLANHLNSAAVSLAFVFHGTLSLWNPGHKTEKAQNMRSVLTG